MMIFSLLVKQQMTNANVEKKKMKEKSTKNTHHTLKLTIIKMK